MSNKSDEEVIIEARPLASKKSKPAQKKFPVLKMLPVIFALSSIIFLLIGAFVMVCGASTGTLAMLGIATILNIGAIGVFFAYLIKEKTACLIHIILAISLALNIISIF